MMKNDGILYGVITVTYIQLIIYFYLDLMKVYYELYN